MSKRREMEPGIAAQHALLALLEAGRYSGYGLTTVGTRAGRRAATVGAEGARRTGHAWSAMRGATPPPPRRMGGIIVLAVTAGAAAGVVAVLASRRGLASWHPALAGEADSAPAPDGGTPLSPVDSPAVPDPVAVSS
jgi:hypothetical protein